MTSRKLLMTLVILAAGAAVLPCTAHAQGKGELVSATAKLNQAQMALVKRLADDPAFATQFNAATTKGNPSAVAELVSQATGVGRSAISVQGNPGGGGAGMARNTGRDEGIFTLASTRPTPTPILSGEVCFDFGKIRGCISF